MLSLLALLNFVFGSSKKNNYTNNDINSSASTKTTGEASNSNRIGKGTTIEGEISASGAIRIEGTIRGSVDCKSRVIVGNTGLVDGDLYCENMEIQGKVVGNIDVKDTLTLKSTAHFEGNVSYSKLVIEPGAVFIGKAGHRSTTKKMVPTPKKVSEQAKAAV